MTAIFLLMCALPKRPAQHVKGDETTPAVAEDKEPELVG